MQEYVKIFMAICVCFCLFVSGTSAYAETKAENKSLKGKIICIDAGHGVFTKARQEKIAPNTTKTKPAFVSGTSGQGVTEEQINLQVAKLLQKELENLGAKVIMTRTTRKTNMSNIDRAQFANKNKADISIKLHCDGAANANVNGISVLIPKTKYVDKKIVHLSNKLGKLVLHDVVQETGAKNRGLISRDDLTGFNWSKVPVILIEMGFMTNKAECNRLKNKTYQKKIVKGIVHGVEEYFSK